MDVCGSCRFWKTENGEKGFCIRFPPVVSMSFNKIQFPVTEKNEICGEYKNKGKKNV